MDFVSIIGKKIDHVLFENNEYSIELKDDEFMKEEGIKPYWIVNSSDGSFEINLNINKIIETVWLFPVNGRFKFGNFSNETTRELVRKKYGSPTSQGDVEGSIFQPIPISWDRYDSMDTCLHFEFSSVDSKLRMITIMDPQIAP